MTTLAAGIVAEFLAFFLLPLCYARRAHHRGRPLLIRCQDYRTCPAATPEPHLEGYTRQERAELAQIRVAVRQPRPFRPLTRRTPR